MKADAYDVLKVFGYERQLFAPLFQRPYVWKKDEQWDPLWNDIKRLAEELLKRPDPAEAEKVKPHFLGAIVTEQFRVPIGKPDARSIIDGQQRLTTLQLLLSAFRDCVFAYNKFELQVKKLSRLIYNEDVAEKADRFKMWPTNIDRPAYRAVMTTGGPEELARQAKEEGIDKDSRIISAYLHFHRTIKAWLDQAADDNELLLRIECLTNALREKIRIVVIDMDAQDDAQSIFETLNARGTPLLPSDLVKNYLFHKAQVEKADLDELHRQYWVEFEEADAFWRGLYGVGHAKKPRIDLFFQHYLTLQTDYEISVGSIFSEFKAFAEKVSQPVAWHLKNLRDYSRYFKRFMEPSSDDREGIFLKRLSTMQFTTVYPFLLGLYRATGDSESAEHERVRILETVESFLVRRMICRLSTRGYSRLFLDLLKCMNEKKEFSKAAVDAFLLEQTAENGRWPDDSEFEKAWLSVQMYPAVTRPRLKMILKALDVEMQTGLTESYTIRKELTVEHLLPQQWETHWPLPPKEGEAPEAYLKRKEQRNSLLHTLGNLTLLTASLNPMVSNGPFKKKKDDILKNSALNLNRFLYDLESWDEEGILKRGTHLFTVALQVWPHGGQVPDAGRACSP